MSKIDFKIPIKLDIWYNVKDNEELDEFLSSLSEENRRIYWAAGKLDTNEVDRIRAIKASRNANGFTALHYRTKPIDPQYHIVIEWSEYKNECYEIWVNSMAHVCRGPLPIPAAMVKPMTAAEIEESVAKAEMMLKRPLQTNKEESMYVEKDNKQIYDLINSYKSNMIEKLEQQKDIDKSVTIDKFPIVKDIKELGKKYKTDFNNMVFWQFFTEEQVAKIKAVDEEFTNKVYQLNKSIAEMKALISIADTYEQKHKILKDYGVIK